MYCGNCTEFSLAQKIRKFEGTIFYKCKHNEREEITFTSKSCESYLPKIWFRCHYDNAIINWSMCYYRYSKKQCRRKCNVFKFLTNNTDCVELAKEGIMKIFIDNLSKGEMKK